MPSYRALLDLLGVILGAAWKLNLDALIVCDQLSGRLRAKYISYSRDLCAHQGDLFRFKLWRALSAHDELSAQKIRFLEGIQMHSCLMACSQEKTINRDRPYMLRLAASAAPNTYYSLSRRVYELVVLH